MAPEKDCRGSIDQGSNSNGHRVTPQHVLRADVCFRVAAGSYEGQSGREL